MSDVRNSASHHATLNEAIRIEVESQLRAKMNDWKRKKDEEYQKLIEQKDADAEKLLQAERKKVQEQVEMQIRKKLEGDYETQMKFLQEQNANNEEKLNEARKKDTKSLS